MGWSNGDDTRGRRRAKDRGRAKNLAHGVTIEAAPAEEADNEILP
jgi:hypothetical protein